MSSSLHSKELEQETFSVDIPINVDDLLRTEVGACGLWQWSIVLLAIISAPVMTTFPVFVNAVPNVRCRMEPELESFVRENNFTFDEVSRLIGPADGCKRFSINWTDAAVIQFMFNKSKFTAALKTESCPYGYIYDSKEYQYPGTIVKDFGLVCDDEWIGPFGTSIFMFGMVVGFILGGWCGDKIGRRHTAIIFSLTELLVCVPISLAPNHFVYHTMRTLLGITNSGKASVLRVLPLELTVAKFRGFFNSSIIVGVLFLHQASLAGWAYLLPNWRWLNAAAISPGVFSILFIFFLPESPRWLNSQGRQLEAVLVLKRGHKINNLLGKGLSAPRKLDILIQRLDTTRQSEKMFAFHCCDSQQKQCAMSKIKLPKFDVLKNVILSTLLFGIQSLSLFGILLYARVIKDKVYLVAFVNSLNSIPGPILASVVYRFVRSRRIPLLVCFAIACTLLLSGGLFTFYGRPETDLALMICSNFALIMLSSSMVMLSIFIAEIFPSDIRARCVGIASGLGRLGGSMSTFVNRLENYSRHGAPVIVYGVAAFAQLLILLIMKDTTGENLQDKCDVTIEQTQDPPERFVSSSGESDQNQNISRC